MCICSFSLRKKDVRHADGEGLDLLGHLIFVWGLFYLCSDSCWELRNSCQIFLSKHLKFKVCSEYLKFQSLYNKYMKLRQSEPYSTWKTIHSNCEAASPASVKKGSVVNFDHVILLVHVTQLYNLFFLKHFSLVLLCL